MADERQEKTRAIDLALSQIEKQFGKGSIMRLGSKEAIVPIAVISTGSISFDAALGVGGFPRGRVVEIFGPSQEVQDHARTVLADMARHVKTYLVWRTIINFGLAIVVGTVFYFAGLHQPWTWAMFLAILNYVPLTALDDYSRRLAAVRRELQQAIIERLGRVA